MSTKKRETFVIITVPHALPGFGWDELSLTAAKTLWSSIKTYGKNNIKPILFIPVIDRGQCDLNRYSQCSMESDYYKGIKDFIDEHQGDVAFLLDVHSFDGAEAFNGSEVAFLDDELLSQGSGPYLTIKMNNYLRKNGVKANVFEGLSNLLHSSLRSSTIKTTLIEFEDHLSDQRLQDVCRMMVDVVNSYV